MILSNGRTLQADHLPENCDPEWMVGTFTGHLWWDVEFVYFEQGTHYQLETRNLRDGADPVLRVFWVGSNASSANPSYHFLESEVAMNDDDHPREEYGALIEFTAPQTGWYAVLAHAYTADYVGRYDLAINDEVVRERMMSGGAGRWLACTDVQTAIIRDGDNVHTRHEHWDSDEDGIVDDQGSSAHQLILTRNNGAGASGWVFEGGTSEATRRYRHEGPAVDDFFAIVGAQWWDPPRVPMSLVWNDHSDDRDGDGLGDRLERVLGTCAHDTDLAQGWDCSEVLSSDTDNDGINDYAETFGGPRVPYRRWGADPRHKDVFVEVDFAADSFSGAPAATLDDVWAQGIVAGYGVGDPDVLGNPSGRPGVTVHFDIVGSSRWGVAGNAPLYLPGNPVVQFDGGGSRLLGATFSAVCGNENCGSGGDEKCYTVRRRDSMIDNRRSTFRYWCVGASGGQASGLAFKSGVGAAGHELGHTLDLQHGGPGGPNCKPNYVSTMNYATAAYIGNGFSSQVLPTLNAMNLCEDDPLNSSLNHLDRTDANVAFDFTVTSTPRFVDWNRDGVSTTCDEDGPVEATVLWATGNARGGCRTFDRGAETILNLPETYNTPSLVRTAAPTGENMLYSFFPAGPFDSGARYLAYRAARFDGECPRSDGYAAGCCWSSCANTHGWGSFRFETDLPTTAASATHFDVGGIPFIYVALYNYEDEDVELWRAQASANPSANLAFSQLYDLTVPSSTVWDPEVQSWRDELWVVWVNRADDVVHGAVVDSAGTGLRLLGPLRDNNGNPVRSFRSPALAVRPAQDIGDDELFLLTTDSGQQLVLWDHVAGTVFEQSTKFREFNNGGYQNDGKPGIAWLPLRHSAPFDGAGGFQVARAVIDSRGNWEGWRVYVDSDEAVDGYWGNRWSSIKPNTGFDLVFNPGSRFGQFPVIADDSVRAGSVGILRQDGSAVIPGHYDFLFFPYASGRGDLELEGADDFAVMSEGICGRLPTICAP